MTQRFVLILPFVFAASVALAHQGVTNPAVMARMNGMSLIGDNVKVLGSMAKGQIAFDANAAQLAAQEVARHSGESIALFAPRESDPKSEARADIWDNFDDFSAKALALQTLASDLAGTIASVEDVRDAMQPLGKACAACHKVYRE